MSNHYPIVWSSLFAWAALAVINVCALFILFTLARFMLGAL